jgi:RNA polymerase sigma-70 factor (ECF subfamily)
MAGNIEKFIALLLIAGAVIIDKLTQIVENQEIDWVRRIAAGDAEAEQELLLFFEEKITHLVRAKIGAKNEAAQDLMQEIRIAIIQSLRAGRFNADAGRLGSYLYSLAKHKIIDYLKSPKRSKPLEFEIEIPDTTDLHVEMEKQESIAALRRLLEKLPHKYKEVLYQRYFLDRSIDEISVAFDLPPRRVSERINYAKKLLRQIYPV